jgi:hypothetical protein
MRFGRIPGMATRADNTTRFLNVDLDICAKFDLQPLVDAFGLKVIVLYVGRERGLYSAHLELNVQSKTADAVIRGFTVLIRGLPPAKRKLWHAATTRDFNIGVQSAAKDKPYEIKLSAPTIQSVSSLKARVVVTVYAPDLLTSGKP